MCYGEKVCNAPAVSFSVYRFDSLGIQCHKKLECKDMLTQRQQLRVDPFKGQYLASHNTSPLHTADPTDVGWALGRA